MDAEESLRRPGTQTIRRSEGEERSSPNKKDWIGPTPSRIAGKF